MNEFGSCVYLSNLIRSRHKKEIRKFCRVILNQRSKFMIYAHLMMLENRHMIGTIRKKY